MPRSGASRKAARPAAVEQARCDEILGQYRADLERTPDSGQPFDNLVSVAAGLDLAILGSFGAPTVAGDRGVCLPTSAFLRIARDHFEPALQRAYGQVLVRAREQGVLEAVQAPLSCLRDSLEDLQRWAGASALQLSGAYSHFGGNPVLVLRKQVKEAVRELEYLRPLLTSPASTKPLSKEAEAVWNLLEGRALQAKEIAKILGLNAADPTAIRKRIAAIKRSGRRIEWTRAAGYFRPDAPPLG